jgi:hypothetical protein
MLASRVLLSLGIYIWGVIRLRCAFGIADIPTSVDDMPQRPGQYTQLVTLHECADMEDGLHGSWFLNFSKVGILKVLKILETKS